uniref:SCP domain-containing protein n=1 Tax=Strongyloides papillosus TaxID=174720 RepID=A0A0N5BS47_STREA
MVVIGAVFLCFVTEINQYRRLHDVPPLKVDHGLNKLAKKHAWGTCLNDPSMFKSSSKIKYLGLRYHLVHGNIIVKNMYEKFMLGYNWYAKHHVGRYDKYAQLIWKGTKKVGVGVCVRNDNIDVVIAFSPKISTRDFNANVRPIGLKHVHMFGVFARNSETSRAE